MAAGSIRFSYVDRYRSMELRNIADLHAQSRLSESIGAIMYLQGLLCGREGSESGEYVRYAAEGVTVLKAWVKLVEAALRPPRPSHGDPFGTIELGSGLRGVLLRRGRLGRSGADKKAEQPRWRLGGTETGADGVRRIDSSSRARIPIPRF